MVKSGPATCELCQHLLAIPRLSLCEPCQRQWLAELKLLRLEPEVRASDLEVEDFLRRARAS